MPQSQEINGVPEPWTLGYLIDVILTRDPWMHRMDIAAAAAGTAAAAVPGGPALTARAGRWTPSTSAGPSPGARPASRSTS
jgi:hypothetical protein